mgnify:CR=1 FL=1
MAESDNNKRLSEDKKTDKQVKQPKKKGRKSKFAPIMEKLEDVYKLVKFGFTDEQIANFLDIRRSTLDSYKKRNKAFSDTVAALKTGADLEVLDSLFSQTKDRFITEETITAIIGTDGKPTGMKEITKRKKFVRASDACIRLWVMNRLSDMFKEKLTINFDEIDWSKFNKEQIQILSTGSDEAVLKVLTDAGYVSNN